MKAIIFDVDGTLSDVEHRKHHLPNWDKFFAEMHNDPVIEPVGWLFKHLCLGANQRDYAVLVVTARPADYEDTTRFWIESKLSTGYDRVYMRQANDFRKDSIVKAEILQKIMDDGYEPFLVVDDRPEVVEMWRSFGITTLQCESDEIKMQHAGKQFLDVLVGPAGAGKSTWCSKNAKPHDIISTDAIREQYGWGHHPDDLARTWNYAHSLLKARLQNQIYTVFDATNIKRKDRLKLLQNVPKGQFVRYIVIDRPLEDKLRDKAWRSEELVLKHDKTFKAQLKDILAGDNLPNVVVIDKRA